MGLIKKYRCKLCNKKVISLFPRMFGIDTCDKCENSIFDVHINYLKEKLELGKKSLLEQKKDLNKELHYEYALNNANGFEQPKKLYDLMKRLNSELQKEDPKYTGFIFI